MPKRPSRVTSSNTSGREAGGEGGAGHLRLVPTAPPLAAGLEQLHDLTGRLSVDVRRAAFADLLPQGSPHRSSNSARGRCTLVAADAHYFCLDELTPSTRPVQVN